MKGMFFLGMQVIFVLSLGMYLVCSEKYVSSVEEYNDARRKAFEILSDIEKDFQILKEEKSDTLECRSIKKILKKYEGISLKIEDASSGLNCTLFSEAISNEDLVELLEKNPELKVEHGWINRVLYEGMAEKGIQIEVPEYAVVDCGMINENFVSQAFRTAFSRQFGDYMKESETKLFCRKTHFWKVSFIYEEKFLVKGIIAAFFDGEKQIKEYCLEEKYFERI